jgi:two-component system, NarL family, response regulator NreC
VKILLVDDHSMIRHGLRMILEKEPDIEVVGEAADAAQALEGVARFAPDVVLMDINLDTSDGLQVSRRILQNHSAVKILILSGELTPELIKSALEGGVSGYVVKNSAADVLVCAIRTVSRGLYYLCPETTTELVKSYILGGVTRSKPVLSEREADLLRLVASGLRNKEIAAQWNVSVKTVEAARSRLMARMNCSSSAELIRYAVRENMVKL